MRKAFGILLLVIGLGCLAWYGVAVVHAAAYQKQASASLDRVLDERRSPLGIHRPSSPGLVGRLEIPRVHLTVMVVEGDDETTLGVAVGHLPDTPLPWEPGNTALAGHRDTFFRPLAGVRGGDELRLTTARGTFLYRIRNMEITTPNDLSVLKPTSTPSLTLVTCYPFVYVGSAPQRYVVRADQVAMQ